MSVTLSLYFDTFLLRWKHRHEKCTKTWTLWSTIKPTTGWGKPRWTWLHTKTCLQNPLFFREGTEQKIWMSEQWSGVSSSPSLLCVSASDRQVSPEPIHDHYLTPWCRCSSWSRSSLKNAPPRCLAPIDRDIFGQKLWCDMDDHVTFLTNCHSSVVICDVEHFESVEQFTRVDYWFWIVTEDF